MMSSLSRTSSSLFRAATATASSSSFSSSSYSPLYHSSSVLFPSSSSSFHRNHLRNNKVLTLLFQIRSFFILELKLCIRFFYQTNQDTSQSTNTSQWASSTNTESKLLADLQQKPHSKQNRSQRASTRTIL
jgi:hypothetical protein